MQVPDPMQARQAREPMARKSEGIKPDKNPRRTQKRTTQNNGMNKKVFKIGAWLAAALLITLGLYAFTDWLPHVSALGATVGGDALMAQGTIMVPSEVQEALSEIRQGIEGTATKQTRANERLDQLAKEHEALQKELGSLRRATLSAGAFRPNIARGQFVSDGCARFLASVAIVGAEKHGKLTHLKSDREAILKGCFETMRWSYRSPVHRTSCHASRPRPPLASSRRAHRSMGSRHSLNG